MYLSGWILAFAPFNVDGKWQLLPIDKILEGFQSTPPEYRLGHLEASSFYFDTGVDIPIKVNYYDVKYDICLVVGGFVGNYDNVTDTIRPSFDILLFDMPKGYIDDQDHKELLGN
jgi:hypothetical protein